jgi:hypothetical protein
LKQRLIVGLVAALHDEQARLTATAAPMLQQVAGSF